MATTFNSLASAVTNTWNSLGQQKHIESALDRLTTDQLIQIADCVRDVFKNSDFLDPPTLCVVGCQSSGKSITLNGLVGLDLLPNGRQIVTRTPIHIRLIHVKDAKSINVDFYDKDDGQKIISSHTVDLNQPEQQMIPIREMINRLTEQYAGQSKNVVDTPIDIKIRSPYVPNLSIIDLPGLTNIALTDQGQPENIKQNIENILIRYIKNPRTIVLSVIQATIDVESDMGLGLIKTYDPEFRRTVGVLTKVDMLKDSNVEGYLGGTISKNLQLGYGYFAVRNRSSDEMRTMSVRDGLLIERKFFDETEPYKSSMYKNKTGSINLGNRLSEILLAHIRTCLPAVMDEIKNANQSIEQQLDEIGRDYPMNCSAKKSMLGVLLHEFQREYNSSIRDRGGVYGTGARIGESYKKFSSNMEKLDPFTSQQLFTDQTINLIVRDYNGIHMPDATISTGVIEKCFQGIEIYDIKDNVKIAKRIEPIKMIKEPYVQCIKEVQTIMIELVDLILQRDRFSRFPKLCIKIKEIICGQIIPNRYDTTYDKVDDFFTEETECIWTDDPKFRNEILPNLYGKEKDPTTDFRAFSRDNVDPLIIRNVLTGYFNVVKNIANHSIRKKISAFFINRIIDDVNTKLSEQILTRSDISQILEENKEKATKRERLLRMKEKIDLARNMICAIH
jgi:hypothetical protein